VEHVEKEAVNLTASLEKEREEGIQDHYNLQRSSDLLPPSRRPYLLKFSEPPKIAPPDRD
jgi:hypothetical protein